MASNRWDALLSNSQWYVPAADLLAYQLTSDNPRTPVPASDQTLWSLGRSRNGRFSGRSVARIVTAGVEQTTAINQMDGVVSPNGQVRINFTSPLGSSITGIGQVRQTNNGPAMQMQMITDGGGSYTTHWANMLRLNQGTTPPEPGPPDGEQRDDRSTAFRWLLGSSWSITPASRRPAGAGAQASGIFTINGYRNGYFWGGGASSHGRRAFTVLGSVTPEGNLFFNAIDRKGFQLRISQRGRLQGNQVQSKVRLSPYEEESGQVQQPLELRLLNDPLISGGLKAGSDLRQPAWHAPVGPAAWRQDWPSLAGDGLDPFATRPERGMRITELAMGGTGRGIGAGQASSPWPS